MCRARRTCKHGRTENLPHFFFHVTTAYAILRHNGVAVGKKDYVGSY